MAIIKINLLSKVGTHILINCDKFQSKGGTAKLTSGHSYSKNCEIYGLVKFKEFIENYKQYEIINYVENTGHEYMYFYLKKITDNI